jgi:thiamine biosynthesis lipoprotein
MPEAILLDRRMGGRFELRAAAGREALLARTARRVGRWEARLTRFAPSELTRLNDAPGVRVRVGPTLGAVLLAAEDAARLSGGLVDPALLAERLAAETGEEPPPPGPRAFRLEAPDRRGLTVERDGRARFDLGGVGKGWIADRALALLGESPSALVNADGDMAIRVAPGEVRLLAISAPAMPDHVLGHLRLPGGAHGASYGVATSGTTVARWDDRHHIVDPRTGRPARTDLLQATVVASTALRAEALAKAVVILGVAGGLQLLELAGIRWAVLRTVDGRTLGTLRIDEVWG